MHWDVVTVLLPEGPRCGTRACRGFGTSSHGVCTCPGSRCSVRQFNAITLYCFMAWTGYTVELRAPSKSTGSSRWSSAHCATCRSSSLRIMSCSDKAAAHYCRTPTVAAHHHRGRMPGVLLHLAVWCMLLGALVAAQDLTGTAFYRSSTVR